MIKWIMTIAKILALLVSIPFFLLIFLGPVAGVVGFAFGAFILLGDLAKAAGTKIDAATKNIEQARAEGREVAVDVYAAKADKALSKAFSVCGKNSDVILDEDEM